MTIAHTRLRDSSEWDELRNFVRAHSAVELPRLPRRSTDADLGLLLAAEALITAHLAAKYDGDECLCGFIEAALFRAGLRLASMEIS